MSRERTPLTAAALVVGVTVASSVALGLLGLPSAVLCGALLGGAAHALTSPTPLDVPAWGFRVGQAVIGVTIGATVSLAALREMAGDALVITLVVLLTVAASLVAGALLARRPDVSRVTGAFALVAGGASGVVAVARDLGADDRVVTVVQYLRVLVVLLTLPVVTALLPRPGAGSALRGGDAPLGHDLLFCAVSLGLGLVLARLVPVSTAVLLGPLLVAAVLAAGGWLGTVSVPAPVQWFGFAMIGAQVGLRFTRASLASIAAMAPAVVVLIVAIVVATGLLGAGLALLTPVDALTAYLATTPGGLFAVLATAADSGADVSYVLAVQLLRLLLILALVPLLARWLREPGRG